MSARRRLRLGAERAPVLALGALLLAGIGLRLALLVAWRPAFLGNGDSTLYLGSANIALFRDQGRPAGYPLFIHVVHALAGELSFLAALQHALGIATALLLLLTVRRVAPMGWGLLPAGVILLAGPQLYLEHAVLSESLFTLVVAAAVYCAARTLDDGALPWAYLAGLLAATAACVRSVGMVLPFLVAIWLAAAVSGGLGRRLRSAGVAAVCAWVPIAAYVVVAKREAGYVGPGLTRNGGMLMYAGVARFADCDRFTPPAGTRGLCERRPPSKRPGPFYYFVSRDSPRERTFGSTFALRPAQDQQLSAFARAVILHQPLDYARDVGTDLTRYWSSDAHVENGFDGEAYDGFMATLLTPPQFEADRIARSWYGTGQISPRAGPMRFLDGYERATRLEGPLFLLLVLLALAGLPLARGRRLKVGLLLLVVSAVTLVVPIATSYFDARFSVPGYGPLAATGALGAACIWERLVVRGRRALSRREQVAA